jgi:urate oxidase
MCMCVHGDFYYESLERRTSLFCAHVSKHTTLPEAEDRLLSTSINCRYEYLDGSSMKEFRTVVADFHCYKT